MNNEQGKIWYGTGIDNSQLQKDAEKAKGLIGSIGSRAEAEGSRIDNSMKKIGGAIAAAFTIQQAANFAKQIANIRGEFQQLEIAFTTMLKSKEKSDQLMKEIVSFAAATPFDLKGVAAGAKQLLAYGFEAENMTENLSMLGNIASGVGSELGDIIYLYGTLNAQGKVMTKDLMQFAGRGIPIYKELSAVLGVTEKEVLNLASSGDIAFKHVEQAFKNMVSESGMFYNLMQEQSKSIIGKISNLGDDIDSMFNEIGQSSEGIISSAISGAGYLVENYKKVGEIVASLVVVYGSYRAAIIVYNAVLSTSIALSKGWTVAELARYKLLVLLEGAQRILNKTMLANPYVAAATAVVALATGLFMYSRSARQATTEAEALNDVTKEAESGIKKEATELKTLRKILNDNKKGYEERKAALDKIKEIVPDYHASLTKEGKLIDDNSDSLEKYIQKLINTEKIRVALIKQSEAQEKLDAWKDGNKDVLKSAIAKQYGGRSNELFAGEKAALQIYKNLATEVLRYEKIIEDIQTDILTSQVVQDEGPVIQNKEYWEGIKKTAETAIEAMDVSAKGSVEWNKQLKIISDAQAKIDSYSTKSNKDDKKSADDRKELLKKISNDELEQIRRDQDLIYQARQSKIDAMKPSIDKELEQMKLDHERRITQINRQQEDLLALSQDNAEKAWKANGSKGKKPTASLSPTQLNAFDEMRDNEVVKYLNSVDKVYKELYDKYLNYTERRKAIEEKFQNDIKAFEKLKEQPGADVDKINSSINEAKRLQAVELNELDTQIANRSEDFRVWVNEITTLGLKELVDTLQSAKDTLAAPSDLSDDDKAVLRAKIEALQNQIKVLQAKDPAGKQEWTDTLKTMNQVNEAVDNIINNFDGLGDATKSILTAATNISGAVISSISGIMALSVTGTEAIKGVERASVILAVIGAAISIVTTMINLFNTAAEKRKEQDEAAIERQSQEYLGLIDYNNELRNKYEWIKKIGEAELDYIKRKGEELAKQKKANEDEQADLFAKLQSEKYISGYETKAKTGTIYFGNPKAGDPGTYQKEIWSTLAGKTFEEISELAAQGKLSKEAQKYYEYLKKAKEEGADLEQMQLDFLQSLKELATGTTAQSITDSIVEGFKAGKRTAADFADTFEELMQGAVQSALAQLTDRRVLEWYDKFYELSKDGLDANEKAQLQADWNKLISETAKDALNLESITGTSITNNATRNAAQRGIATASQESVDENNGRLTAIQGFAFNIFESLKILQSNSAQSLKHLAGIENNTARLEKIENTMVSVKSGIDDTNRIMKNAFS